MTLGCNEIEIRKLVFREENSFKHIKSVVIRIEALRGYRCELTMSLFDL